MAPDLVAALKAGWAIVHFVTVSLPGHTIRWTDAGFARWGSGVWKARDPIFGTLHEISDITDGIDDDASPVTLTITPPSMAALEAMASADAQGGWVVIHLAAIDPATGTLATPYQLHMGELDQPRLAAGKVRRLEYDIITGDARGLQPNEEQRQSDAFRQLIWPGERGDEFATEGTKLVYWREDEPRNAVGLLSGRGGGKKDDNKAIEFSYEPNAPLAFPFGRVGVGGSLRYRVGYGPTNRWQSVVATVGASGPVKGLVNASFDDEITFFDANNRATNGSHRGEMWFSFLPGAQPSPALTAPTGPNADGGPAGLWSPAHKLSGRPCFMWTGKENSKKSEYRGGLPKPVLTIDGLYGYDPLLDSTRGGTGNCRIDNPTTWPWLNEGARAALNWAIGRWEGRAASGRYGVPYQTWAVGGIAAPIQTIDVQAFAHAARIADANNWKVAAVPRSDEDKVDVLNDLLKASGAVRSRRCGMISCVSFGAPTPSVLTATEADTIAAPQVSLAPSRLDRRNTGIPSFLSAQHRWELTPIAAVTDQDWFEEDGGRHTEGYSYRYVPAAKQAAQLCYLDMATEREKVEAEVNFKAWMMALEPGVAFDWAAREYGLDGTKVRVWKRTWSPRSCSVKIKFREETDAKYAKAFAQTGEAPPAFAPPLPPVVSVPVNRPIWTSDPYPVTGSPGTIKVAPHEAMMPWGEIVSIAGAIISGLDGTKIYGVFWRPADSDGQGGGVEVEAYPASSHMADGSWIFLGWQAPANERGEFPQLPVAPPGHGGIGDAPGLPIAGDVIPTAPTIVGLQGQINAAFGDIFDVSELLADARTELDAQGAEIAAARGGQATLSARISQVNQARIDGDEANAIAISGVAARTAHTEADIIDLENALANETMARAEAVAQLTARSTHKPNLIDNPSGAGAFRGWSKEGSPASYVDDDRLAGRIFVVYGYMVSQVYPAAPGDQHSLGFMASPVGDGGHVRLQYVTPGGLVEGVYVGAGGGAIDERRRSSAPSTAPAGTTGFRLVVAAPAGGLLPVWGIKVNFGSVAADFSDDYSATVLAATVTEQSLAIVDLENQQSLASFRKIAEASGAAPAYYEFVSSTSGGYAAIAAPVVALLNTVPGGDPLVAMEAENGRVRFSEPASVIKDGRRATIGPGFGVAGDLLLWSGPTTVGYGSETVDNGILGISATDGFFGGKTSNGPFDSGPPSASVIGLPAGWTTVATVASKYVYTSGAFLLRADWQATLTPKSPPSEAPVYGLNWRVISTNLSGGDQRVVSSGYVAGAGGIANVPMGQPYTLIEGHVSNRGDRRFHLQLAMSGTDDVVAASARNARLRGVYYQT